MTIDPRLRGAADLILHRRLRWTVFFRLVVAVSGIGAVLVRQWAAVETIPQRILSAYVILVFACAINLVYLIVLRWVRNLRRHAAVQTALDVVLESLLVYFTGGVESIFAYLYFASVLGGAILVSARAGVLVASVSTVCLSAVTIAYSLGRSLPWLLPEDVREFARDLQFLLPYLFFFSLSLHLVAVLAGRLAMELSRVRILNEEILEHLVGGLLAWDRQGRVAFFNKEAQEILRIPDRRRAVGRPWRDLVEHADLRPLVRVLEGPVPSAARLEVPGPGGGPVWLEVRTSPLPDEYGHRRGTVAIFLDISMQRRMEAALRRAERLDALAEMSAGMAHEVRNPLASMRGAIQELATTLEPPESEKILFEIVLRESDRLDRIVGDFLRFARSPDFVPQPCHTQDLLHEVTEQLGRDPAARGIRIQRSLEARRAVRGDPELLRQVFLNLGLNALQATPEGGSVTFRSEATGGDGVRPPGVIVTVEDEGAGLPKGEEERIYDPFYTTKQDGTGLGLSVAQRIVRLHRGTRRGRAREDGRGAAFEVWLPETQGIEL